MKVTIMKETGADGSVELPVQFTEPIRPDLIQRAVLAIQARHRQPYGGHGDAGMRHSSELSRRRRNYRGSYGMGISRVPRKILTRRGRRMFWVGATVPSTVGGRRAHGPKPFKDWEQKINTKENRKAIRSALAASMDKATVSERGHKVPDTFPFVLNNAFETLKKTTEVEAALVKLGFAAELDRADNRKIRAGIGTMRGRKYKQPTSILFVVGKDCPLAQAAANLPGTDVQCVDELNAEILAPGAHPGRLTLYTQSAIERLAAEELYTKDYKGTNKAATPVMKPAKKVAKKTVKTATKTVKKTVKKATKKGKKKSVRATKKSAKVSA